MEACPVCMAYVVNVDMHIYWHEKNDKDPKVVESAYGAYKELKAYVEGSNGG